MFLNSIRWRLQLWHGLLLVLVLAGFGVTAYQLQRANLFRRIDQQLQRRNSVLASALRRGGEFPGQPPRDGFRPPGMPPEGEFGPPRPDHTVPGESRPGRFHGPNPEPGGSLPFPPRDFHLSPQDLTLFEGSPGNAFYYLIWVRDGTVLSRSDSAPATVSRPTRSAE